MTGTQAGYLLLILALLFGLAGWAGMAGGYLVGCFLAISAALVGIFGPPEEARDARRRNHARPARGVR